MPKVQGFHHITALCGPAQENYDFYARVLGLRLVKLTVNYDDAGAYHLYYGDGVGTPGSILTFFPYPNGRPGRPGRGSVNVTSLAIPREATAFWVDRLRGHDVEMDKPVTRNGRQVIGFRAPDGLGLELHATPDFVATAPRTVAGIPAARAIGRVASVTMSVDVLAPTEKLLVDGLGAWKCFEVEGRHGYGIGDAFVEVVETDLGPQGRGGHGSVHHVAFRVADEAAQQDLKDLLAKLGVSVSPVMDRTYFKSIYFREPGGALFEIATLAPGFLVDESEEALGSSLKLPPQFEPKRRAIERHLNQTEIRR